MSLNATIPPTLEPYAPGTEPTPSADSTLDRTLNHRYDEEGLLPVCFFTTDDCYHDPTVLEAASDASLIVAIRTIY